MNKSYAEKPSDDILSFLPTFYDIQKIYFLFHNDVFLFLQPPDTCVEYICRTDDKSRKTGPKYNNMKVTGKMVSLILLAGCTFNESGLYDVAAPHPGTPVEMKIDIRLPDNTYGAETRSGLLDHTGWGESSLYNLTVAAYCGGKLECSGQAEDGRLSLMLPHGQRTTLYALANLPAGFPNDGNFPPKDEEDMKNIRIGNFSLDEYSGFPLAGTASATAGIQPSVTIPLTRLVAKIVFSLDASAIGGLEVTSATLRQTPQDIAPFCTSGAATSTGNGDSSSEADVNSLNSGGSISLYMLENCQGILLPDNDDPWDKTPENIGGMATLCTYLELNCNRTGNSSEITSEITYRFYLGQDETSDFNVFRNTVSHVTLYATEEGLGKTGWKIEVNRLKTYDTDISIPEYAGQWGHISIPEELEGTPGISAKIGGNEILFGSVETFEKTDGDISIIYDPDYSRNMILFRRNITPSSEDAVGTAISVSGGTYHEMDTSFIFCPEMPLWKFSGSMEGISYCFPDRGSSGLPSLSVSEDGYEEICLDISMCGSRVYDVIPVRTFLPPEDYISHKGIEDEKLSKALYNDFVEGIGIGLMSGEDGRMYRIGEIHTETSAGSQEKESVGKIRIRGLEQFESAGNIIRPAGFFRNGWNTPYASTDEITGSGIFRQNVAKFEVYPAFPDDYNNIGENDRIYVEVHNNVLEDPDGGISEHVSGRVIGTGTQNATWEMALIQYDRINSSAYFTNLIDDHKGSLKKFGLSSDLMEIRTDRSGLKLVFSHPDYSSSELAGGFPHGSYLVRGTVNNPISGRTITGYYVFDIILDIPLTFQIDGVRYSDGRTFFDISMVPFSRGYISEKRIAEWWNRNSLPLIGYYIDGPGHDNYPDYMDWYKRGQGQVGRAMLFSGSANNPYIYTGILPEYMISSHYGWQDLQYMLWDTSAGRSYLNYMKDAVIGPYENYQNIFSEGGREFSIGPGSEWSYGYFIHAYIAFDGELMEYIFGDKDRY